jgi:hypothetical protein
MSQLNAFVPNVTINPRTGEKYLRFTIGISDFTGKIRKAGNEHCYMQASPNSMGRAVAVGELALDLWEDSQVALATSTPSRPPPPPCCRGPLDAHLQRLERRCGGYCPKCKGI